MAIKRINLLPNEMASATFMTPATVLMGVTVIGVLTAGTLQTLQTLEFKSKTQELGRLTSETTILTGQIQAGRAFQANQIKQFKTANQLKEIADKRVQWSGLLKELTALMPEDLWLTELTNEIEAGVPSMALTGESPSQAKMASFLRSLEFSVHFRNVRLSFSEELVDFRPPLFRFKFTFNKQDQTLTKKASPESPPEKALNSSLATSNLGVSPTPSPTPSQNPPQNSPPNIKANLDQGERNELSR